MLFILVINNNNNLLKNIIIIRVRLTYVQRKLRSARPISYSPPILYTIYILFINIINFLKCTISFNPLYTQFYFIKTLEYEFAPIILNSQNNLYLIKKYNYC